MQVRLIDIDSNEPLRVYRDGEYFSLRVLPEVGSKMIYHKFNGDKYYEGESVTYEVLDVLHELQESYNGTFDERLTLILKEFK